MLRMRPRPFWARALVLSVALAGCDAGLFYEDELAHDVEGAVTSSTSGACVAPQVRATYALGGTVLLPWGEQPGYVLVRDERILGMVASRDEVPPDATVVETDGVIAPGLIDLHNHVAYNFLPPWTPPRLYRNRYEWQREPSYAQAVRAPYNAVKGAGHLCQAQKYGELRALMGGTTSIQGSIGYACQNGWVRNIESRVLCEDHIRQSVLSVDGLAPADAAKLVEQFDKGITTAYLVHLAEGVDDRSRGELDTLRALGLLRKEVVAIHGTGLSAAQLGEMGAAGMKLIWSPQSNLGLYGSTTDIPAALAAGVKVALAPDWTPSGSNHLLAELKVADRINREQWGGLLSDAALVAMATTTPAEIAGYGDRMGQIAAGFAADLVVVKRKGKSALRALIEAEQRDVLLTVVAGKPLYGEVAALEALGVTDFDALSICGEPRGVLVRDATVYGGSETLADVVSAVTVESAHPWPLDAACPNP